MHARVHARTGARASWACANVRVRVCGCVHVCTRVRAFMYVRTRVLVRSGVVHECGYVHSRVLRMLRLWAVGRKARGGHDRA